MKKKPFRMISLGLASFVLLGLVWAGAQEVKDVDMIVGNWDMEVDAGGEYYYLSFTVREEGGQLSGTISEESGAFIDAKMEKIEFNGQEFRFEMTVPTPPDGLENLVKGAFEWTEGQLEGTLIIEEFGMTAYATCTKKK
ncbi:MAG: hypothetical protein PVI11_00735 [Candidatus Aminicenantes bacterium]|jgi:hypothetical protein